MTSSFFKKEKYRKIILLFWLDKLTYVLNHKISLPVDNIPLYLLKFQFVYFGLLAWYETVQN